MADITVSQVKAARALLGWKQPDLADAAGVSVPTIKRYETGTSPIPVVKAAIVRALEDAGITFVHDGKFVGVKLIIKRAK
jgi:transcriptional regulator with XRE-family HTH domain